MLDLATALDLWPLEYKAEGGVILTDHRDAITLKRYLRGQEKNRIARQVKALWKGQVAILDTAMMKAIIAEGGVPQELNDIWRGQIIDFVEGDLAKEWIRNLKKGGDLIAQRVNKIEVKQYAFSEVTQSAKAWVDTQGGSLIVDLSKAQYASTNAMIQAQVAWGTTSPALMSKMIKPTIGLTGRESLAVQRFMATMVEEGASSTIIAAQAKKYAGFLHENRAFRIARTEISNAYNFGQLDSVRHAAEEGHIPGAPMKEWIAGGQDPCEICEENADWGAITLKSQFASGDDHPTAHPQCECSVGYSVKRDAGPPSADPTPGTAPPTPFQPAYPQPGAMAGHVDPKAYWTLKDAKLEEYRKAQIREAYLKATGKNMSDEALEGTYQAFTAYAGEESAEIRMAQLGLRKEFKNVDEFKDWLWQADKLEEYIKYAPQFDPAVTIYRGVESTGHEKLLEQLAKGEIKAGHKMTMETTSHWSSRLESAQNFDGSIVYETKGIKKSTSIMHFSEVATDYEVMVSKGVEYTVKDVTYTEVGKYRTYRVVLEPVG